MYYIFYVVHICFHVQFLLSLCVGLAMSLTTDILVRSEVVVSHFFVFGVSDKLCFDILDFLYIFTSGRNCKIMVCPPVRGDCQRAFVRGLSLRQVDKSWYMYNHFIPLSPQYERIKLIFLKG